jgi:chemotaxis protein methyltransferase CheR
MTEHVPVQVLTLMARFVEERTGLHYSEKDRELFAHKLEDHAADRGFDSVLELYYSLRYDDPDGAGLDALIDALVVGETYFFREQRGLEVWLEPLVARARRGERLRIWSAACATGEEPVSIAVMLAREGVLEQFEIVASDISPRAIERAKRGEYGRRAHRAIPAGAPPWISTEAERAHVDESLRARIDWRRLSLADPEAVRAVGTFDGIACRNVLIYFDDATVVRVVSSLGAALRAGGELLIGASESLLRYGSLFRCIERGGVFLYAAEAR